ncbi:MAG: hypothetical protein GX455_09280 [Phycisphaerae bacterium]|nr:hypothetical protein [Phycisphaerae bacterium]
MVYNQTEKKDSKRKIGQRMGGEQSGITRGGKSSYESLSLFPQVAQQEIMGRDLQDEQDLE